MQAFLYCRVSSDEQASDNHYSLENQEIRARDYCKSKDWRVVEVRKDIASGKDTNRDGFGDLVKAVEAGRVDVVIVYRLDRLSRNVRDIYDFTDLATGRDVALVSLNESLDTTTAMGRAMLGVMAVFAQLTREMIAENVKDGLMRRAQSGRYIGNKDGPLGYRYDPESNSLNIVTEEAETVRLIFELFIERKWGIEKIVGYLNEKEVRTKTGAEWSKGNIGRIIRNPVYMGKLRCKEVTYEGQHDAVVSEEVFLSAQDIIASRSTLPGRSHQSQHLLSGLARCGACGKRLVAHYGQARKSGERHVFYFHRPALAKDGCKSFYRSAKKLEAIVIDVVRKAAESDLLTQVASDELATLVENKIQPLRARSASIVSELGEMKEKFNTWADRLDRKLIDEDQFTQQNARLLKRKQELQQELDQIDRQLAECENSEVSFEAARRALADFPGIWDRLEIEERRELLRLLVEKLEVHQDKVVVKLTYLPEQDIQT